MLILMLLPFLGCNCQSETKPKLDLRHSTTKILRNKDGHGNTKNLK